MNPRPAPPLLDRSFHLIAASQRQWARREGIPFDGRCRVAALRANLFRPLRRTSYEEFAQADGRELEDKFLALYSSAALVANFFDCSRERPGLVGACLGFADARQLSFERKLPLFEGIVPGYSSDSRRKSPNVDLEVIAPHGALAIECKFSEPFVHYPKRPRPFSATYFSSEAAPLWDDFAVTRRLALRLQQDAESFSHLDAVQLIKTALACRRRFGPGKWRFIYIWFEVLGDQEAENEGCALRRDLSHFLALTEGEIPLEHLTWRELFARFAAHPHADAEQAEWFDWIRDRYFSPFACKSGIPVEARTKRGNR